MDEVDLVNRDPNSINQHVSTIAFNDVLAEPDAIHSIDCVWKFSHKCFECWKSLCYKIMTTLFGICIAAEWGCEFAYIAFYHIWYITPILKVLEINCAVCQKLYGYCINCCIAPTINFEDVLAEPDAIHSIDCVWKFSHKCFECWKSLCYKIMTTLFGICIAAEWGCVFAYIAFYHIWYITPVFKMIEIECSVWRKLYTMCIGCCISPICEACGSLFNAFKSKD
ncbi:hypothetical protein KUTeg_020706 [Tegillarca granosa]|uniref:Caveolin n=1 Tax=Tegillarca granosa TaxID=220873 RepID=A0ABQ9E8R8_TEGGR|nr:hypothetical protein KUTeg_020706 [Tegillarca granosa]